MADCCSNERKVPTTTCSPPPPHPKPLSDVETDEEEERTFINLRRKIKRKRKIVFDSSSDEIESFEDERKRIYKLARKIFIK